MLLALYNQLFQKENLSELWTAFLNELSVDRLPYLLLVFILLPFNWLFETLKWYPLVRKFSVIRFVDAFKAVLAGVTVSLFTPNRIGEYGGRLLLVEAKHNWKAVVATIIGSWSQLLVLISGGLMGLIYFAGHFFEWSTNDLLQCLLIGFILVSVLLYFYVNIKLVLVIIRRLTWLPRHEALLRHLSILETYSRRELFSTLKFAFLRYLTYSLQYFLILQFFGVEVDWQAALAGIASIFLIQTSVPLPPLMGLVARGDIAIFIWGFFSTNDISILAATFSLFIINLCLPALLGMAFIVKINVIKSLGYENETNKNNLSDKHPEHSHGF